MLSAILWNIARIATKYPTLSLIGLFVVVCMVPSFTSAGESLKLTAATPITAMAGANPLIGRGNFRDATIDAYRQELAIAQLQIAELKRKLDQFDTLASAREAGMPAVPSIDADVIIGRDPSPYRQSIVINRGTRHGVRIGDPVVHGRVLVGRIDSAGPWASRVQLISDPAYSGVKILVLPTDDFAGTSDETLDGYPSGLARGSAERELCVELEHIELDANVAEGQLVFTSSLSATVPGGLIVGRIERIDRAQRPQFATVYVQPWSDPQKFLHVQVLQWRAHTADLLGDGN